MPDFSSVIASGSTNGRNVLIVATATPGTVLHTTGTSASVQDEIYVWAYNDDTVSRLATIEFGGTTSPNDLIRATIPAQQGALLMIPGWRIRGTGAAGLIVAAFASVASVVTMHIDVARIT